MTTEEQREKARARYRERRETDPAFNERLILQEQRKRFWQKQRMETDPEYKKKIEERNQMYREKYKKTPTEEIPADKTECPHCFITLSKKSLARHIRICMPKQKILLEQQIKDLQERLAKLS